MTSNLFPRSAKLIEELQRYVVMEPKPFALDLERCHGSYLVTVEGVELLDLCGYYGAKLIAHNHPALQEPVYLRELALAANNKIANPDFLTPQCLAYYRLLHRIRPRCMADEPVEIYAVNSGAEAVENMMKYFINLHDAKMTRLCLPVGHRRFIYFDNAFHGRTVFALNITRLEHDPVITEDFVGIVPGNIQVPFPALNADEPAELAEQRTRRSLAIVAEALERYRNEVVGIVVEPIQGAGGHRLATPSFYQGLSNLAHQHEVCLGFDEVQTAGGQCGAVFAADLFHLPHPPQAISTAKKFANGVLYMRYPMDDRGILDSTWGGTLADMVRFVREWEVIESEGLLQQVAPKTEHLLRGLKRLADHFRPLVRNVRGLGLYHGFSVPSAACKAALMRLALEQERLVLLGAGSRHIRFRPTLSITVGEIDDLLARLERCFITLQAAQAWPDDADPSASGSLPAPG